MFYKAINNLLTIIFYINFVNIRCDDLSDLYMISCLTQDAITCKSWLSFNDNIFTIFINRFCWENAQLNQQDYKMTDNSKYFHRVNSILSFQAINSCFLKNLKHNLFRSILGIVHTKNHNLKVIMSDQAEMSLDIISINIQLKDISLQWHTDTLPKHQYYINNFY